MNSTVRGPTPRPLYSLIELANGLPDKRATSSLAVRLQERSGELCTVDVDRGYGSLCIGRSLIVEPSRRGSGPVSAAGPQGLWQSKRRESLSPSQKSPARLDESRRGRGDQYSSASMMVSTRIVLMGSAGSSELYFSRRS